MALPDRGTPAAADGTRLRVPQVGQVVTADVPTTSPIAGRMGPNRYNRAGGGTAQLYPGYRAVKPYLRFTPDPTVVTASAGRRS